MSTFKNTIRNRHVERGNIGEIKSHLQPTETVPDEAMSIPYIMARYVKGLPVPITKQAIDHQTSNFDSPDWEKMAHLDLVDHDELREQLEEIETARKEQAEKRKKKSAPPVADTPPVTSSPPAPVAGVESTA